MSEYTQTFENGTWVKGDPLNGESFAHGMVVDFDSSDGQHLVAIEPRTLADIGDHDKHIWCEPDALETANVPEWVGGGTEHVFVLDWMEDDEPKIALYADTAQVFERLGADAPENLQLKLMEAVADPGARVEVIPNEGPDLGIRFTEVVGNER